MQVQVRNPQGEVVRQVEISDALFAVPMNEGLVHQALVRQRANARQGTASTKSRGQVRGGGRKPWRQKGTGRARAGSIRSPIWRGGGVTFGPKPRNYRQALPKKMRRLAIKCCLSDKAVTDNLILVDGLRLERPRTKELLAILQRLGAGRSTLLVTPEADSAIVRSARNIPKIKTLPAPLLNVGDLLSHNRLVMTLEAVRQAEEIWAGTSEALPADPGEDRGPDAEEQQQEEAP